MELDEKEIQRIVDSFFVLKIPKYGFMDWVKILCQ